ncbi:MAG: hypothetical protein ACK5OA_06185, partial [Acidovorax sp.]
MKISFKKRHGTTGWCGGVHALNTEPRARSAYVQPACHAQPSQQGDFSPFGPTAQAQLCQPVPPWFFQEEASARVPTEAFISLR